MTDEAKFDAELAWDIQEWTSIYDVPPPLQREDIKGLAEWLTEKGYHKGKSTGLSGLLSTLEETGAKLVDEFGPLIDTLRKPR